MFKSLGRFSFIKFIASELIFLPAVITLFEIHIFISESISLAERTSFESLDASNINPSFILDDFESIIKIELSLGFLR